LYFIWWQAEEDKIIASPLGNDCLTKGEYDNAIVSFNKAIEKKENHADAFVKKTYALSYLKKYDEAIKCFDKAIEINSVGISV